MSTTTCYSAPALPGAGGEVVVTGVASEAAAEAAAAHQSRKNNQSVYANLPTAEIIDSLPLETRFPVPHRLYGGFWKAEFLLKGMAAGAARARACFEPNPSDIFLASLPKSGTTWLKALAFATLNRGTHPPFNADGQHPLSHHNPHDCVSFLELMMIQGVDAAAAAAGAASGEERGSPVPRLIATHLPCSWLPPAITAGAGGGSRGCRIVYVCREPKDVLVSYWTFSVKAAAKFAAAAAAGGDGHGSGGGGGRESAAAAAGVTSFEEAFELFCEGRFPGGPHWLHALEYWRESQRRTDEVLFLRYEDMLRDPVGNLKKLAAFMGCPFSEAEEKAGGVVDEIVALCSLENLKSMDVNKNGSTTVLGVTNDAFFRKGQVGDWKNYMTLEMAARLDKVVEEATQGSGLTFADSVSV
ncbi:cytosolic sulfotransferase 5-like [Miscanthus floridulus]|uniref:cytosolic sulfotransferase 5-like n=1 Tax=Miscanthus floridulus TaxID=154761 RepID=UPI00345796D2